MSDRSGPPSGGERLLRAAIRDPEWRDAVLGDLAEEHRAVAQRLGRRRARAWYWRQAIAIASRVSASRVLPGPLTRRPWRPPVVDAEPRSWWAWSRDARYAIRALLARPALSAVIVLTLGLALAANATIFNLADALYLRPFRFQGVDRLVVIASAPKNDPYVDRSSVAPADYRDWVAQSTTLTAFAAADFWDPNLSDIDQPEQLVGFRVTPSFFRAIKAEPLMGRLFTDDAAVPGRDRQVVISHGLWTRRFGADPGIVGRSVRLNGEPYEVVGITQPGPRLPYGSQIWAPLAYTEQEWLERSRGFLLVLAQIADGQSLDAATTEMESIVARQRQQHPDTHARREVSLMSLTRGLSDAGAGPFLAIWQVAALLLLLIATANVANLLLARGTERQHEFAVRLALGAGRGRLALQVLFEGAWLALASIALAVPLAALGVEVTRRAVPASVVRWVPGYEFLRVDLADLAVTALLGAGATLLFSLLPALQASKAAVADALRQSGRTTTPGRARHWLGTGLAAGQIALTLALIVGSVLILSAVDNAVNGALGFDKRNLMTAQLTLPEAPYQSPERRRQFVTQVVERVSGMPAVESVGVVSFLPYQGTSSSRPIHPEGVELTPAELRRADQQRATPEYFATMRIPILEGRGLSDTDTADARPVVVVSRSLADRYWPGESPLGRRFRIAEDGAWLEVVGVAEDIRHDWFMQQRRPTFYRPAAQDPPFMMAFAVRTSGDPLAVAGELRRAIGAADPDQPILQLATMDQVMADKLGGVVYLARALAVMSGIALVLAVMGVYSLIAYLASRRTQEIGVRMALGATRWQVVRLTIAQALVITGLGLVAGTALAVALGQVMSSALFGLVTLRAWPVVTMVVALGVVSVAAAYLPARRAAALDPTDALRTS